MDYMDIFNNENVAPEVQQLAIYFTLPLVTRPPPSVNVIAFLALCPFLFPGMQEECWYALPRSA